MIDVNTWYRVVIDGEERIVRIDTYIIRYAIVDYYDGRVWYISKNLKACKKWIIDRRG